jgi:hypothetical protein
VGPKMAGLDIIIYVFMVTILLVMAVLTVKVKGLGLLGLFGGLLGSLFTYICFTNENLILNTVYDQTAQVFVNQVYSMEFFSWVPLILTVSCFVVATQAK